MGKSQRSPASRVNEFLDRRQKFAKPPRGYGKMLKDDTRSRSPLHFSLLTRQPA
ncbi:MAG: hypothetical protein AAGA60_14955 [Cyanobacteria bacterium P01_E01_bin.42]